LLTTELISPLSAASHLGVRVNTQQDERIRYYLANLRAECESAALYAALAEREQQPELREVFSRLGQMEQAHAQYWQALLRAQGYTADCPRLGWRAHVLIWLGQRFGPGIVLPTVMAREVRDHQQYATQPEAIAARLPALEHGHARILQLLMRDRPGGLPGSMLATLEGRHRAIGGNALRAAVLGANDGLVSNVSLVMGVAGADLSAKAILLTGLAGLLAGSLSMALGEWLSVQSARELYAAQVERERQELEAFPAEEQLELELIYRAKGLPPDQAHALATQLVSEAGTALDTLLREELAIDPEELGGSAWEAAGTSFLLFSIGAIIPVFPYFFVSGTLAVSISIGLSALALFLLGVASTLLTGQSAWRTGLRQVLIGTAAALLTFGAGRIVNMLFGLSPAP